MDHEWSVETKGGSQVGDLLRRGGRPGQLGRGIAGSNMKQEKRERDDAEEDAESGK